MKYLNLLVFFLYINIIYCQEKSLYERKIEEINIKYIRVAMGPFYKQNIIDQARKDGKLEELKNKWTTFWTIDKQFELTLKFASMYKDAKKLMTQVEKEKEIYKKTDYGILLNEIKQNVNKWLIKDEFEKTDDYIKRVSNDGEKEINKIILNTVNLYTIKKTEKMKVKLESYNADNEIYYSFVPSQTSNIGIRYISKINSENAKILNAIYDNELYHKLVINNEDWVFSGYHWVPNKFAMYSITSQSYNLNGVEMYFNNMSCSFEIRYREDIKKFTLNKKVLEINNQYLKDFIFIL